MDQEKYLPPIPEEEIEASENQSDIQALVPDDALAPDKADDLSVKEEEMLPQSLSDEDDFPLDEDDGLFTDEEIASLVSPAEQTASEASLSAPSEDETDEAENADALPSSAPKIAACESAAGRTKAVDGFFDVAEMFIFALAFVLIAMSFFFRHSVVDGGSMEDTLFEGEHLIISDFLYDPKPGDIVVVQDASKAETYATLAHPIVKRVIAIEGQTVSIRYNGEVYVDGVLLDETYVKNDFPDTVCNEVSVTVPQGCLFLMGDHRNVSLDSREAGCFREEAVLGKVILRFLPFSRFGTVN